MIVTSSDFVGKYALSNSMYDTPDYDFYINTYEREYLIALLGADLAELFIADLIAGGGTPTIQRFIDIFDAFSIEYNWLFYARGGTKRNWTSEGMKVMLTGFVYFEIVRDQSNKMTPIGNVSSKGENSDAVRSFNSRMWDRYNRAIQNYRAIQSYIMKYRTDYPEFNGEIKKLATWI